MENQQENSENQKIVGRPFSKGVSGNPNGRPKDTPEKKLEKRVLKELISNYQQKLAEALPKIEPVLVAKAMAGDVPAIKELHDRVMGKPQQKTDITSGGKPVPILGGVTNVSGNERGKKDTPTA